MEDQQARVESSQSDYSQQISNSIQTLQTLALALNTGGNDFSQSPALSPARSPISDILNASEVSDYLRQINDAVRGLNDYISPQNSPAASSVLDETFQNTESQSDYSQQIINSIQILQTIASALNTGENNFSQSPALSPARSPISDILNASEVSDYFRQINDAVRGLNDYISPQNSPVGSPATSSSISLDEGFQNTECVLPSETVSAANDQARQQQQRGGNLDQNQRIERQRFNNIEIRRSLSIGPPTQAVPDIAEFYTAVMNVLTDLANDARSIAERNDFVQLELVWGDISHHINISVTDNDAILPAFEEFLDELVQSNAELPSESNLELILQIVKNPTGDINNQTGICTHEDDARSLTGVWDKILYIDTDSLIYVVKDGESPLELGNYLGDLTDELGGDTIQEFVAAGPKSYAYQTKNQKNVVIRVKGITQTYECSERVNFDSIRELVGGIKEHPLTEKYISMECPQQVHFSGFSGE
ncbi:uncharacterized protein LOC116724909 [Xiphophorus hellerii]|uniref:uncharacterized protein LOC116724909 n=1 Tax=Xiphophorus hellerii TaxID=8084 RepID=UPI0013B39515|nr:uncharacterized protein LOC116724909 [Xiphophorus hellerii]